MGGIVNEFRRCLMFNGHIFLMWLDMGKMIKVLRGFLGTLSIVEKIIKPVITLHGAHCMAPTAWRPKEKICE